MIKPAHSPRPFPPLWRDILKFFVVLIILFMIPLFGALMIDLFPGLVTDDPR